MSADPRVQVAFDAILTRMHADLKHNEDGTDCLGCRVAADTLAPVVVAALDAYDETALRERIAADLERKSHEARNEYERGLHRYGSAVEPGSRDPWLEGAIDAYLDAARIARGTT